MNFLQMLIFSCPLNRLFPLKRCPLNRSLYFNIAVTYVSNYVLFLLSEDILFTGRNECGMRGEAWAGRASPRGPWPGLRGPQPRTIAYLPPTIQTWTTIGIGSDSIKLSPGGKICYELRDIKSSIFVNTVPFYCFPQGKAVSKRAL